MRAVVSSSFSLHKRKAANLKPLFLAATVLVGLTACTPHLVEKLPYYKLDVVQGMPLDAQAILSVRPGMTRQQVTMEIGTPLLRTMFRSDRWDYLYSVTRASSVQEQRALTIFFDGDIVSRIEGDALDYAREQVKTENTTQPVAVESNPQAASASQAQ